MLLSTNKLNFSKPLVWLLIGCALISGLSSNSVCALELATTTHIAVEIAALPVENVIVGLPSNAVYQANDEAQSVSVEGVLAVSALRQLTGVLHALRGQAKSHRPANAVIGLRG